MNTSQRIPALLAAASTTLILLTGCSPDRDHPAADAPSATRETTPQETLAPEVESAYVDGTYTARGVYGGAPSYMDFTVTIEGGIIMDVESGLMEPNNDTSRGYQERFAAALPDEVIGKSIDEVEVGVLAGASSCGDGFNDAIAQIREQAAKA